MVKTIRIKNKNFELRDSNRSLLKFEEMTNKSVMDIDANYTDILNLFYCVLYGANKNKFKYEFEDFLDILDEDDTLIDKFTNYLDEKNLNTKTPIEKKKMESVSQ